MQSPGSQGTRDASTPEVEEVFSLAADPQLAENSRQGSERKNRAFALGFEELKSQTMQWGSWQASGRTASVPTVYLYDGINPIEEVDSSGSVLAKYTQGGLDEELSELRSGTTSYYLQDGLGSVTSLSNSAGSLANTYTYDSFGKLTASTGSLANPFKYTGREFDSETGTYYNRARYFDQNIGRFLSEDKIGFSGGINFYSYANNSPIGFKDPTGLAPCNPAQTSVCSSKCRSAGMAFESCSLHRLDLGIVAFQWTWCSCQSPFGKCSGIRHATLQGAVDSWCKSGASACSASMSCAELANNMNVNAACAAARECINGECYGGGDPGHQEAAANARAAAQKCLLYMMMKGCK
jgi:RHS repeat-associated protein